MTPTTDYDLTTGGTARAIQRSEATVREYERTGRLKAIRTSNGQRLFSRSSVEALKQELSADAVSE